VAMGQIYLVPQNVFLVMNQNRNRTAHKCCEVNLGHIEDQIRWRRPSISRCENFS